MATYTFTASSVTPTGNIQRNMLIAGEAIDAGMFIYKKASDGKAWKAVNNTEAEADVIGIALNSAAAGQPVLYSASTEINTQAAVFATAAVPLILSATAGKGCDPADLGASDYLTYLGYSTGTATFQVAINVAGVAEA